nr:MAG TPA: antitoxin [Caudoviricetes sp.]
MHKYDLQLRALRNKNGLTLAQLAEKNRRNTASGR